MHGRVKVKSNAQKEAERAQKKKDLAKQFNVAKEQLSQLKEKFDSVIFF